MLGRATAAALVVLAGVAQAIVVSSPTATSVWSQSADGDARIEWSLLPATSPPPATQYFDIYLRNGVGAMYTPSLNLLLATKVDSLASTYLDVAATDKFVPGPGYQLFFSDPANPATVYCDSDVFAIGSYEINGPSPTSSSSSDVDSSTQAEASASSTETRAAAAPTSTEETTVEPSSTETLSYEPASTDSTSTSSGMITSVTSSSSPSPAPVSSSSSSAPAGGITAAPAPGGPNEQGFNLVPSGASGVRAGLSAAAGLSLLAGAGAALLL
ncbi:hypothetical protein JCM3775_006059 [Rhodotorula graminis]|uniref:Uncharacterized protein n=1 Tax=Rhodotorula graminis (strain WP1) TaxID=578459 RepID=A0A194SAA8_RHOGW|nr:uncharacterized protein RHOBADRAFT_51254 [Rhodotorula graminis WP1]KPV77395.1 hypothetical protein RHOBADRAFT_51254 [Rhodotorula graminis WP1]